MDKLTRYRSLVKRLFLEYSALMRQNPPPGVETGCAIDEERDQFLLVKSGWQGNRRVRHIALHVRLKDDKIWVEEDWLEDGIATDLVREGVPKEDIVLAFHPPDVRRLTDYAVA